MNGNADMKKFSRSKTNPRNGSPHPTGISKNCRRPSRDRIVTGSTVAWGPAPPGAAVEGTAAAVEALAGCPGR